MLRFSEEIMLLLLDDKGGRFIDVPTLSLEYALAGAVLMDLAMEGRIDTDPEQLFVIDPSPLGDDLLAPTLSRIGDSEETFDAAYWIKQTGAVAEN
ncbi:MAG: GPP34 family phosphoprotein, partial [Rhodospirillaceae bacterium]|nr:GPP34 family phosphoprotein [Rhodospirillaceae bacterium]